jgi:hypothetical protein
MPSPPPGWYPDPSGRPVQRYFDGRTWTVYRGAPGTPPPYFVAPLVQRPSSSIWPWLIGGGGIFFVVLVAIVVAVANIRDGNSSPAATHQPSSQHSASYEQGYNAAVDWVNHGDPSLTQSHYGGLGMCKVMLTTAHGRASLGEPSPSSDSDYLSGCQDAVNQAGR